MKKTLQSLVFLFLTIGLLQSCMKEKHETKHITINETIASGSTYSLDLSAYEDEDEAASISHQADHYSISQIDKLSGKNIYHFSITTKFQNTETVELAIGEEHNGGRNCGHEDKTVITINFTIQ